MKEEVYQLNKVTGLGVDYYNEFVQVKRILIDKGLNELKLYLKRNPIRTYEQYFDKNKFENVVTENNRDRIIELNTLVFTINSFARDDSTLSINDLNILLNSAHELIYD